MNIMSIYDHMPIFLQNAACNAKGFYINKTRYNKDFQKYLKEFCERGNWSIDDICRFRDEKLREMVHHCYSTVPYYRRMFDKLGVIPDDIQTLDDMKILPILTKREINKCPKDFLSTKIQEYRCVKIHTSGTTGAGLKLISSLNSIQAQWATFWRHYLKCGIEYGMQQAMFSGQKVVPAFQKKPPFWRRIDSQNRIYFSAYHGSEDNLFFYFKVIKEKRIPWLAGYPSLLTLLSDYMNRHDLHFENVRYVTTGAENLYDYQIESMKSAFGVMPIQVYGETENVAFFSQDPDGHIYIDEDAGAVELLKNEEGTYDVIGTNLYNYAMPLLRYRIGDTVTAKDYEQGKRREILSIDGRAEDYIYLPSGEKLGRLDYAFKDAAHIAEAQIYQHKDYSIVIKVVTSSFEGEGEAEYAKKWFENVCKKSIPISIEYVGQIPRTQTQKLRYVISEVGKSQA